MVEQVRTAKRREPHHVRKAQVLQEKETKEEVVAGRRINTAALLVLLLFLVAFVYRLFALRTAQA